MFMQKEKKILFYFMLFFLFHVEAKIFDVEIFCTM